MLEKTFASFAACGALCSVLLLACAPESHPETKKPVGGLGGGKFDLPNDGFYEREHDGSGYKAIAEHFGDQGYDLNVEVDKLNAVWPLENGKTSLLSRFGTPIMLSYYAYFHTALDVVRADETESAVVLAPVTGKAKVFDWWGTPGYNGRSYETVIGIWDPDSHLVAQLMHVEPSADVQAHGSQEFDVVAGQPIGVLSDQMHWLEADRVEKYRHTHFDLVDGVNQVALDPAELVPYNDNTPPQALDVYFLDEFAEQHDGVVDGRLDVALEAFDRDEDSNRNFEVDAIAFEISDQGGRVLASSDFCRFDDLYDSVATSYTNRALRLIDFGSGQEQIDNDWPQSDIGNRERTFRYALTQFYVDQDGKCDVREDRDGFIDVDASVQSLNISGTLRDVKGNTQAFSFTRTRENISDGGVWDGGDGDATVSDSGTDSADGGVVDSGFWSDGGGSDAGVGTDASTCPGGYYWDAAGRCRSDNGQFAPKACCQ